MTSTTTSKQWYTSTPTRFEKKVAESLRQRAKAYDVEDQIGRIEIPTEEVVEMKGGRKVQTATRFFPGYILVELETEDGADGKKIPTGPGTWYATRPRSRASWVSKPAGAPVPGRGGPDSCRLRSPSKSRSRSTPSNA